MGRGDEESQTEILRFAQNDNLVVQPSGSRRWITVAGATGLNAEIFLCGKQGEEGTVMDIQKVGVVGCGLMGSGIAQVTAQAGYHVVVREVNDQLLDKGMKSIEKS